MINLTQLLKISSRSAIDNALTQSVGSGRGFAPAVGNFFFFFSRSFCFSFCFFFRKTDFHFLTDLKHTGRLIPGSLSALFLKYSKLIHKLALATLRFAYYEYI